MKTRRSPVGKKVVPDEELLRAARSAMERAYAPYSRFRVGAAVRAEAGRVFTGCNVENASYGLTVCAERVALCAAIAAGAKTFRSLAVVAGGERPPYPCGACRQVMREFLSPRARIWVAPARDIRNAESFRLQDLLPRPFVA